MLHYGKTGGVAIDVHVDRPAGRHGKLASKNVFRHGPFNDFLAMDGLYVVIAGANIDPDKLVNPRYGFEFDPRL